MALLETEIAEIRDITNQILEGKIPPERVQGVMAGYSQIEKRIKHMIQAVTICAKYGRSATNRIISTNLIGDHAAVTAILSDPEKEQLMCPAQDNKLISRSECLDYSGKHNDICAKDCKHFGITRRLLIGPK